MAIREFSPEGSPRAKIAFVGAVPDANALDLFRDRGFQVENYTVSDLSNSDLIGELDAVIWSQNPRKLNRLARELPHVIPGLLDHDVRTYIRIAEDQNQTDLPRRLVVNSLSGNNIPTTNYYPAEWEAIASDLRERPNSFLSPSVYLIGPGEPWSTIANTVGERLPVWPINTDVKFDEPELINRFGSNGHDERMLLLRRSFWNCSRVDISSVPGGLSGAPVFKIYATLAAGLIPQGPGGAYLYFAKIGPRKKIVDEYDRYTGQIFEYIPFHLGPRLRRDRCNLGSTQGILVGDFVEGAEPLLDCARGGRCGNAISSLFDKTLGSWRKQMSPDPVQLLKEHLDRKWRPEGSTKLVDLPSSRLAVVRRLKGRTSTRHLKAIFDRLAVTAPMVAPAHGDMHAGNVLVRHGDAILIDFEKLESNFPTTYDPASLEGGLLTDGFVEKLKPKGGLDIYQLAKLLTPLYELSSLTGRNMTVCKSGDPTEWYYGAVNQIRAMGWASERESPQYALTLAVCLIKKGCNTHDTMGTEQHEARALAFFFGQKILRELGQAAAVQTTGRSRNSKKVVGALRGRRTSIRRP